MKLDVGPTAVFANIIDVRPMDSVTRGNDFGVYRREAE